MATILSKRSNVQNNVPTTSQLDLGEIGINTYDGKLFIKRSSDDTVVDINTDTQLSDEQVQDIVGDMVSGNTETNINTTYDDTNGKLDFAIVDGPGSGLDADTLDGAELTDLDNKYVDVTGDTMTGDLTVNTNIKSNTFQYQRSTSLPDDVDLDDVDGITYPSGFYDCKASGSLNTPYNGWIYLEVQRHRNSNGYCKQIVTELNNTDERWYRIEQGGTWGDWHKIITDNSIKNTREEFTATSNQTSFGTSGFKSTAVVDVFQDGVMLRTSDYSLSTPNVTLSTPALEGDTITVRIVDFGV